MRRKTNGRRTFNQICGRIIVIWSRQIKKRAFYCIGKIAISKIFKEFVNWTLAKVKPPHRCCWNEISQKCGMIISSWPHKKHKYWQNSRLRNSTEWMTIASHPQKATGRKDGCGKPEEVLNVYPKPNNPFVI